MHFIIEACLFKIRGCFLTKYVSIYISMFYCTLSKSSKDTESKTLCAYFIEEN